jgi:hypothetical protein
MKNANCFAKPLKALLGIFLFLLPWQTILIYKEKFLNGAKWEYGTLGYFGTEIILWLCIILFIFWFVREKSNQKQKINFYFSKDRIFLILLLCFYLYVSLSVLWAQDFETASQSALRITESILLFLMLFIGPLSFKHSVFYLLSGVFIQSILGILQFLTQSTFGFKWLGLVEHRSWEAGTSIISDSNIGRWLRAYGAFPHPNVFGGFLVLSLILTNLLFIKSKKPEIFFGIIIALQTYALFLTFSRSAWISLLFLLVGATLYAVKNNIKKLLFLNIFIFGLVLVFSFMHAPIIKTRLTQGSTNEVQSTTERISGYKESIEIFKNNYLLGVGAGNYTVALYNTNPSLNGWEYQPVHNVFLLILVELGIFGFLILLSVVYYFHKLLLFTCNKKINLLFITYIGSYLILLMFDHYLFSSYAGLIISAVFLSLLSKFYTQKHT